MRERESEKERERERVLVYLGSGLIRMLGIDCLFFTTFSLARELFSFSFSRSLSLFSFLFLSVWRKRSQSTASIRPTAVQRNLIQTTAFIQRVVF